MRKIIAASLAAGLFFSNGVSGVWAQSESGGGAPGTEPEEKSIGQATGEAARDFKVQAEETLKKFQESAQALLVKLQEEIRKFNESYNRPKPPAPAN